MSYPEEKEATLKILNAIEEPLIVELGAQNGEDAEWILAGCASKRPRGVFVEADRENYEKLLARKLGDNHIYIWAAIADHEGECEFWENHDLGWGYGSIYEPLPGLSVNYNMFKKIGPIPCATFDEMRRICFPWRIDLLRADIHGAEKDMIKFGQNALANTHYLFIEYFEQPLYKGMATRTDLLAMLPGWKVIKQFPWNLLLRNENW